MPGEDGGEHVVGVELIAGAGFATPLVDSARVDRARIASGESGEVVVERCLVDDDVDQRFESADGTGSGCRAEDRQEGVEATLRGTAIEQ